MHTSRSAERNNQTSVLYFRDERSRESDPIPCFANKVTPSLMASIEDVLSTESGSVSPRSSQRILGLWAVFFLPGLRLFQTEARSIETPPV